MAWPVKEMALLAIVAGATLLVDQVTKRLVLERLPLGASWAPIPALGRWFTVTHVRNTGAAFGLFPQLAPVFLAIAVLVIVGIVVYARFLRPGDRWVALGLGLMLGGASGNLVDRLRIGHVVDFLDFKFWPVFNCADSAIVVGVGILLWALFWEPQEQPSQGRSEGAGGPSHAQDG